MRGACMEMVHELARRDPRVVYVGSDLGAGTLDAMKAEIPERFFMEGVSEANLIGMAAGLAMEGFIPYVHTISTFITRRAFEQVAVDLCLHDLPVRLIGNGGGLVYAPLGPTHMAVEDIAAMRSLPGMTVVAPVDAEEMRRFMPHTLDHPGPIYIRLAKGYDDVVSRDSDGFEIGRAITLREPGEVLFVTTGVMAQRALASADMLRGDGIECGVLHMHTVKPLDAETLLQLAGKVKLVVTVEEHTLIGGLGGAVAELFTDHEWDAIPPQLKRLGLPDRFLSDYGSQDFLLERCGLDPAAIAATVREALPGQR
jgi:transketolase